MSAMLFGADDCKGVSAMNRTFFRRSLSGCLAVILSFSLAVPALAEETSLAGLSASLDQTAMTLSDSPGTLTATVEAVPSEAALPADLQSGWSSDAPAVASVEGTGTTVSIYPNSPGIAAITFRSSTADASYVSDPVSCTVTVLGVTLSSDSLSLDTRETAVLTAGVYGGLGDVSWSSGNESIATVSSSGTVTAVNAGSTAITATAGGYSASCTVTVSERTADVITASATAGSPLSFLSLAAAINTQCKYVLGSSLSYVTNLSVPTSAGTLYCGYVSESVPGAGVGSGENFHYLESSGSSLSDVSFVPKLAFSGVAVIQYTGFDASGAFFTGTIRVSVAAASAISYSTSGQNRVDFQVSDFSTVCQSMTGHDLQSVTFDLPSASKGTLYCNYSGSSLDQKVSEDTAYFRSKSPYLSSVSFVPAETFTGTVSIPYLGYDTAGSSFSGLVKVTVSGGAPKTGSISYSAVENVPVHFDVDDFDDLCEDLTGAHLRRVSFDLPSSSTGKLYYNYTSSASYGSKVSSSALYYRSSSPYLDLVSFVPASDWTGTVKIGFTGSSVDGDTFSGTVSVSITAADPVTVPPVTVSAGPSAYFTDLANYSWAVSSIDSLYAAGVVYGTGPGVYSPAAPMDRGSFLLMICRAFGFSASTGTGFADVPSDSYYADAITTARSLGIALGNGSYFYPTAPLTREQAAVFLLRAMRADGWTIADGTRAYLAAFSDSGAVSDYAVGAVAAMVQLGILRGDSSGRLDPQGTLTRAQMAMILYRALTL